MFNKIGIINKHLLSALLITSFIFSVLPIKAKTAEYLESDRIIVSLGDSYSSGEGIEPFGQSKNIEDKIKDQDWLAHRSEKSWSGMLALAGIEGTMVEHRNENWYFGAVSGATTADIITSDFYNRLSSEDQKDWDIMEKEYFQSVSALASQVVPTKIWHGKEVVSFQLDIFQKLGKKKADYVTVTIGGNDVGFTEIVEKMATSSAYLDISGLYNKIETVKTEIQEGGEVYNNICNAYKRIADAAGSQATIIVAGYPQLFDSGGSKVFITDYEVELVNSAVITFNKSLQNMVKHCKKEEINICFVSVEDAFKGHGAYSQNPYINEIMLGTQSEDIDRRKISSAYSVHPNYNGACAYAKCVQAKINELEGLGIIRGTVIDVAQSTVDSPIPVLNASVSVYANGENTEFDVVHTADTAGAFEFFLPAGVYSFVVEADGYMGHTTTLELTITDKERDPNLSNIQELNIRLYPTDSSIGNDIYSEYLKAAKNTTASGSWAERLTMTADMAITDGSAKTKTKVTLTSDADVSNYSESDPSQIRMSGSAEMTVMGQTYAWNMEYENGTAHYRYTKPNQTSADMKIDPSFFNFGTMTRDMMTNAKLSGNKITFTVPGEKIAEVGIAAVNQMSGIDNLEYGDVDVTVTISNEGKIDNIVMVFHASLEYQGYDADVDYNIDYRFFDSANISSKPVSSSLPIASGIYAQDGADYNTLTVHEADGKNLEFTAFWYRIGDLSNVAAVIDDNVASFEFFTPNAKMHVFGTLYSPADNALVLKISESTHEYVTPGEYRYSLVGKIFSDAELKAISAALNVPGNLNTQIKQGEPGYWEGGGIYRTPVEIYYNGELIAGASVNSLTGELAGNIYVYSAPDASGNSVNLASTFGFSKAWDIHDHSGTEHFVTSLAFSDDGTFCCAVGWYLSEWYAAFTGTYQVNGNEIILNYTLDGDTKMSSYQVKWEDQVLRQTSEENLVIAHQIGSEYSFEENPWYTAEQLKDQVSTFMRYNG